VKSSLRDSSIPTSAEPEGGGGGPARPGEVVGSAAPGPASARATEPGSAFGRSRKPLVTAAGERGGQTSHSRKPACQWCRADPLKGGPADSGARRNPSREAGWKDPSRGRKEGSGERGDGECPSLQKSAALGPAPVDRRTCPDPPLCRARADRLGSGCGISGGGPRRRPFRGGRRGRRGPGWPGCQRHRATCR